MQVITTLSTFFPALDSSFKSFVFLTLLSSVKDAFSLSDPVPVDTEISEPFFVIVIVYVVEASRFAAFEEYAVIASVHNPLNTCTSFACLDLSI